MWELECLFDIAYIMACGIVGFLLAIAIWLSLGRESGSGGNDG